MSRWNGSVFQIDEPHVEMRSVYFTSPELLQCRQGLLCLLGQDNWEPDHDKTIESFHCSKIQLRDIAESGEFMFASALALE